MSEQVTLKQLETLGLVVVRIATSTCLMLGKNIEKCMEE